MKTSKFTKLTGILTLLAMLTVLAVLFTVGSAAEGEVQAQWGAGAESLTASGTLQEAFDAARRDPAVTYVKLVSDVASDTFFSLSGGNYTLDLNGKTISYGTYVLNLYEDVDLTITDTSAEQSGAIVSTTASPIVISSISSATVTVLGGTLQGEFAIAQSDNADISSSTVIVEGGRLIGSNYAIYAQGTSFILRGGSIESTEADIIWRSGNLDISEYDSLVGLTVRNSTEEEQVLALPEGYSLYNTQGERESRLLPIELYTVDQTKYRVDVTDTSAGDVILSPSDTMLLPGTTVTVEVFPDDGYVLKELQVFGAELDTDANTFTVADTDVTVTATFEVYQADWGTDANTLTHSGSLQTALDAAAQDPSIRYIRLVTDLPLGDGWVMATGGCFTLDLNGYLLDSNGYVLYLKNSVELHITDTSSEKSGRIKSYGDCSAISVYDDSAIQITVSGGTLEGNNGIDLSDLGAESQASLLVTGGTIVGWNNAILAGGASVTVTGGELDGGGYDISWCYGSINLSNHPDPTDILVCNSTGTEQALALPAGYSWYNESKSQIAPVLLDSASYVADETRYRVTYFVTGEGQLILSSQEPLLPSGTQVLLTVEPFEGHLCREIVVEGAEYDPESKSFVIGEQDVTVTAVFVPYEVQWGTDAENLTNHGSLEEALVQLRDGDYLRLVQSLELDSPLPFSNQRLTLDLNGYGIFNTSGPALLVSNGADVTFVSSYLEKCTFVRSYTYKKWPLPLNGVSSALLL